VSYMRGACYIWRDDERVHVWAEDGSDGWHDSSWAEGLKHAPLPQRRTEKRAASGFDKRSRMPTS
jgi:hypothetical protein